MVLYRHRRVRPTLRSKGRCAIKPRSAPKLERLASQSQLCPRTGVSKLQANRPSQDQIDKASLGDPDSQCELGIWYANQGTAESASIARDWFLRAKEQGSARANHNLGVLSRASDPTEAFSYFEAAANAGYVLSMRAIGLILADDGDMKAAWPWLAKAAEEGDGPSKYALAKYLVDSEDEHHQRVCHRLALEAANDGNVDAQALLGTIFHEGIGTERSPPDATYWWQRAAFSSHAGAQMMLGAAYHTDDVFKKDIVQEAHWIIRSCRQGNELAINYWETLSKELSDEQYAEALALVRRPLDPASAA